MTTDTGSASKGVKLAQRALHAIADGNEQEALAALNSASPEETMWANAYLLSGIRGFALSLAKGNTNKAARLLLGVARNTEDALMAEYAVTVQDAERGGLNG